MNEHPRATDDELTQRIARALRSRESVQPDPTIVAARIEAQLAQASQASSVTSFSRRTGRVVAAGVVTSALAVAGAGAAAAANPYTGFARVVENAVQAVGVEWSAMPEGYTREQYEAFWGAENTDEDVLRLSALWRSDATETKARAGQMILDGETVPPPPGGDVVADASGGPSGARADEQYDAYFAAGYSATDAEILNDLWGSDYAETKARAGQMILSGQSLPFEPGEGALLAEPDYSEEQYDAFWSAGYQMADVEALGELWGTDDTETKARAGQMIIDGQPVPVAPGEG